MPWSRFSLLFCLFIDWFFLETGSLCVALANLRFTKIYLLLPPSASLGLAIVIILATETVHSLEFAVVFALFGCPLIVPNTRGAQPPMVLWEGDQRQ